MPEIGMIVRDNEGRVQCHCCDKFMGLLAPHAKWKHGYSDFDEYKKDFGINKGQGLCSFVISESSTATLKKRGLTNSRNGNLKLGNGHLGCEHRLQARKNISVSKIGVKITLTAKKMMAQKANSQKSACKNTVYTCNVCSHNFYDKKFSSKRHFCPDCKKRIGHTPTTKEQRKIYNKRAYAKRNLEKMRGKFNE